MATGRQFLSVDFEVYGKVQGVFFRKYTKETAYKLGLVGWVENTPRKTVIGQVQGPPDKIAQMLLHFYDTFLKCDYEKKKDCVGGQQWEKIVDVLSASPKWKTWLRTKGSPKSKILKCEFKNEKSIESNTFKDFEIRK